MKLFPRLTAWLVMMACLTGCRESYTKKSDVPYGVVEAKKLLLDIYQPVPLGAELRPGVLVIHGGGWSAGDKSEGRDLAKFLVKHGYVVFSINYRLVTETTDPWPAQLDDTQRAVRWVRAHSSAYGVDPKRLAAIGGSAGGHLVACLATMPTRDNSDQSLASYSSCPTCVVMMCGPTDLTDDFSKKVKEGAWTNEVIRVLLGHPKDYKPVARTASPLFFVNSHTSPTLIIQGNKDPIVPLDQAERFDSALKKADVESELFVFNGGHGFDDLKSLVQSMNKIKDFLNRHLSP